MFTPNEEQNALVRAAGAFCREHEEMLEPVADRLARARRIYEAYAGAGYHALLIPEEFGGGGLDFASTGLVYQTLSYHLPGTLQGPVTTAHCVEMMKAGFQGDHRSRELAAIASRGLAAGFCLTEDGAGSDISAITTTAQKTPEGYVIQGIKSVVINHALASYLIVFAATVPAKGRAGLNAFLVDPALKGVFISEPYDSPDFSGSIMGEVLFDSVNVPGDAVLGEAGSGYFLLMETLDKGRPLVAACCTGSAMKVFDMVLTHAKGRSQFGKDLFSFQGVSFPLAEHATRLKASELLTFDALKRIDEGRSFSKEASMAKLYASETLFDLASFGMETLGYRAACESHEIRRILHEAELMKSIDGTANVQKMVIASQL
jgi:alkylation response protein AidB-like acyl-CoA dehydrogenase